MLIGSFFGALNALGISILGEYVVRIYDQVRSRPLYVVDREVSFAAEPAGQAADEHPLQEEAGYLTLLHDSRRWSSWRGQLSDSITSASTGG